MKDRRCAPELAPRAIERRSCAKMRNRRDNHTVGRSSTRHTHPPRFIHWRIEKTPVYVGVLDAPGLQRLRADLRRSPTSSPPRSASSPPGLCPLPSSRNRGTALAERRLFYSPDSSTDTHHIHPYDVYYAANELHTCNLSTILRLVVLGLVVPLFISGFKRLEALCRPSRPRAHTTSARPSCT